MPATVDPMSAVSGPLPDDLSDWAAEIKWDGIRAVAFASGGRVRLQGRRLNDITPKYEDLAAALALPSTGNLVLDGELVSFDADGRPDFHSVLRPGRTGRLRFVAFDLLHCRGRNLCPMTYERRRSRLAELGLSEPWMVPGELRSGISDAMAAVADQGLEGLVLKRIGSPYRPGVRSRDWLKVKNRNRQEFVVGGWLEGSGSRRPSFASLLLGYNDRGQTGDGRLRFAGRVGSGFDERDLEILAAYLKANEIDYSPFDAEVPGGSRFVTPRLVVEVEFAHWTADSKLRQPVFLGLRDDKSPRDVVRESAGGGPQCR